MKEGFTFCSKDLLKAGAARPAPSFVGREAGHLVRNLHHNSTDKNSQ